MQRVPARNQKSVPVIPIKIAKLNGFRQMLCRNIRYAPKIRNRPGNVQHAIRWRVHNRVLFE